MLTIILTTKFRKDVKTLVKRGFNTHKLKNVIGELSQSGTLSSSYRPHKLAGSYSGYFEAHIEPDWLIIWKNEPGRLKLIRTGTHSDLF